MTIHISNKLLETSCTNTNKSTAKSTVKSAAKAPIFYAGGFSLPCIDSQQERLYTENISYTENIYCKEKIA